MPRLALIGDSIACQYGPYLTQYLQGVFEIAPRAGEAEALLNLDIPWGANGGDSARVLATLREPAKDASLRADVLLLNCGLHDIKTNPATGTKQVPLAQYIENLRAIVTLARARVTTLVWVRTTPCDEAVHNSRTSAFHRFGADVRAYNAAADGVMTTHGVPSIDLYGFTLALGPDLYCDHVHFPVPIREKQAAYIAGWLAARIRV